MVDSSLQELTADKGVVKQIILEGDEGDCPKEGQKCKLHYEGRLTNGTVFDSSYER